jgi:hypothetical protein
LFGSVTPPEAPEEDPAADESAAPEPVPEPAPDEPEELAAWLEGPPVTELAAADEEAADDVAAGEPAPDVLPPDDEAFEEQAATTRLRPATAASPARRRDDRFIPHSVPLMNRRPSAAGAW